MDQIKPLFDNICACQPTVKRQSQSNFSNGINVSNSMSFQKESESRNHDPVHSTKLPLIFKSKDSEKLTFGSVESDAEESPS